MTISIHAPSRERQVALHFIANASRISIHAPSRERRYTYWRSKQILKISIHAPSRERLRLFDFLGNFNTISIHAPSRERPDADIKAAKASSISIHAPSRERRRYILHWRRRLSYFNPRSLAGATGEWERAGCPKEISIHAPSRERQYPMFPQCQLYNLFQSTLPRGSDRNVPSYALLMTNFNPRSLAGATADLIIDYRVKGISIHAPSRERRQLYICLSVSG